MKVDWSKGLVPTVVQDKDGQVLTLCYSSEESLAKTLETGDAWYCSRKRGLWRKGETSGNTQKVIGINADCDNDALLFRVVTIGPGCHTGKWSCFGDREYSLGFLYDIALDRKRNPSPKSYTSSLFKDPKGENKLIEKLGEEAVELIIAAKEQDRARFVEETADLLYFIVVLLAYKEIPLSEILAELEGRR